MYNSQFTPAGIMGMGNLLGIRAGAMVLGRSGICSYIEYTPLCRQQTESRRVARVAYVGVLHESFVHMRYIWLYTCIYTYCIVLCITPGNTYCVLLNPDQSSSSAALTPNPNLLCAGERCAALASLASYRAWQPVRLKLSMQQSHQASLSFSLREQLPVAQ